MLHTRQGGILSAFSGNRCTPLCFSREKALWKRLNNKSYLVFPVKHNYELCDIDTGKCGTGFARQFAFFPFFVFFPFLAFLAFFPFFAVPGAFWPVALRCARQSCGGSLHIRFRLSPRITKANEC